MHLLLRATRMGMSRSPLCLRSALPVRSAARWRGTASLVPPPPQPPQAPLSSGSESSAATAAAKPRSVLRVCAELSKARLSSLVVFTSSAGFLMAGAPASWTACAAVSIGTALAAAAAGTFNQVWESSLDGRMKRTQGRPLPAGAVSPAAASAFGAVMTAASAATLLAGTNPVTAALGLGNIALYALVYTPLKTRSELSTAVGAVVGAVPPVMGWAAASGGDLLAFEPLLLGLTLFWWQFPHFYALGWTLRRDYARGGYAMAPVTDPTGKRTAMLSLRSAVALAGVPVAAALLGVTTPMFAVEGALLNAALLLKAYRFYAAPGDATARPLFKTTLWYLPVLLCCFVFHSAHWVQQEQAQEAQDAAAVAARPLPSPAPAEAAAAATEGAGLDVVVSDVLRHGVLVATDTLRHAGKALCVHETVKDARASEAAAAFSAALCPVAPASAHGAQAHAGAAGGGEGSGAVAEQRSGTAPDLGQEHGPRREQAEQDVAAAAAVLAREQVRAQCPVVVAEPLLRVSGGEAIAAAAALADAAMPLAATSAGSNTAAVV